MAFASPVLVLLLTAAVLADPCPEEHTFGSLSANDYVRNRGLVLFPSSDSNETVSGSYGFSTEGSPITYVKLSDWDRCDPHSGRLGIEIEGGPGKRFVRVNLTSAPGRPIDCAVEIYVAG